MSINCLFICGNFSWTQLFSAYVDQSNAEEEDDLHHSINTAYGNITFLKVIHIEITIDYLDAYC